jgi:hypothetical protein
VALLAEGPPALSHSLSSTGLKEMQAGGLPGTIGLSASCVLTH